MSDCRFRIRPGSLVRSFSSGQETDLLCLRGRTFHPYHDGRSPVFLRSARTLLKETGISEAHPQESEPIHRFPTFRLADFTQSSPRSTAFSDSSVWNLGVLRGTELKSVSSFRLVFA